MKNNKYSDLFPVLKQTVNGKPLTLLGSLIYTPIPALTQQRLNQVIEATANGELTRASQINWMNPSIWDQVRRTVGDLIKAKNPHEIIFTKNATEAAHFLAADISKTMVDQGDQIIISPHSCFSTVNAWERVAKVKNATVKRLSLQKNQMLDLNEYKSLLANGRVKVVSLKPISSITGATCDIKALTKMAHDYGAIMIVDGGFSTAHAPVDVQDIDCDYYYFSSYRLYAPPGIAPVYRKQRAWAPLEAHAGGTQPLFGAVGLSASIEFIQSQGGVGQILSQERRNMQYAIDRLQAIPGLKILDWSDSHIAQIPFVIEGISPEQLNYRLDRQGILTCWDDDETAAPELLNFYGIESYSSISLGMHNTPEDIDRLIEGITEVRR